jgi:hypothetical protein
MIDFLLVLGSSRFKIQSLVCRAHPTWGEHKVRPYGAPALPCPCVIAINC